MVKKFFISIYNHSTYKIFLLFYINRYIIYTYFIDICNVKVINLYNDELESYYIDIFVFCKFHFLQLIQQ